MRVALNLRLLTRWRPVALALAIAAIALAPRRADAHEIPKSVTVFAWLRPDGATLRLVARVPLEAMRDIPWPLRGPGYLQLGNLDALLRDGAKLWLADNLTVYEGDVALPAPTIASAIVSLQSDRSFDSWTAALAHATGPSVDPSIDLAWQQAMVDVVLEYPIHAPDSRFSLDARLARLGVHTTTVVHLVRPDGAVHDFTWQGDPGLVHLEPRALDTLGFFGRLGFTHILDGLDHLLFLLCLVIPFRRLRPVVVIATAFTVAHSITMIASALGYAPGGLWFPPLVEVLIAVSIVWTAFENIVGARLDRRWQLAFVFGLVHGFGFSFALRDSLQFAGTHLAAALAAFNAGVEVAQVAVLALLVPALGLVFRRVVVERIGTIILSALVAHTAWHWMTERWTAYRAYRMALPSTDAGFGVEAVRVAIVATVAAAAWWAARPLVRRLLGHDLSDSAPGRHNT
jgi:hypothetical protein